jgi:hypothetical protein
MILKAVRKDDAEKEMADTHPKKEMAGEAFDVLYNVATRDCLTRCDEVLDNQKRSFLL